MDIRVIKSGYENGLFISALLLLAQQAGAAGLFIESFENDTQFTVSSGLFSDGGFDYLGLTSGNYGGGAAPSGLKTYTGFSGSFLSGMDLDGEGATLPVDITWSNIDISGHDNLEFSGLFAEAFDAPGDIDFDDFLVVSYAIDGGPYQTLVDFRLDVAEPDNFNGIFREDTNGDNRGEGAMLSDNASNFTKSIAGTGNSLDLRLTARVNAGDEDFAVDTFAINGTPTVVETLFNESFENDDQFTVSSGFFSDGGFDYLGLSSGDYGGDPAPSGVKPYTGFSDSFLTGMDLDGEGATLPVDITWSNIDISGFKNLQFSGLFAEWFDSPGDIDFDDFLELSYAIDGGAFQSLLDFRLDEDEPDNFNGIFREDTDGDNRGDGDMLGGNAENFFKTISGTGDSLDLRLTVRVNAGDEDFAIDTFRIKGVRTDTAIVPEPSSLAMVVAGLALSSRLTRRRNNKVRGHG